MVLANPILVFLAVISYNLYLWHFVVMSFLINHKIPWPRPERFGTDPTWQWAFFVAATVACIAVAAVVTYAIELPLLQCGRKRLHDAH